MKKVVVLILLTLPSVTGLTQTSGKMISSKTEQDAELTMLHESINAAILEKNRSILSQRLDDAFVFTSADAQMFDKKKFIDGFVMNPGVLFTILETLEKTVVFRGSTAIVFSVVKIQIQANGKKRDLLERLTETYISDDAHWKALTFHATYLNESK
jgi:hypothetical protein